MNARPEPSPAPASCPLCGTPAPASIGRCGVCNYDLAGVAGRAGPFSRAALCWAAVGLLVVYTVTLVIVALAR